MGWYVLFVETGKEAFVQDMLKIFLNHDSYYSIVPQKLISEKRHGIREEKKKVIFPGYVFINMNMSSESYYEIKKVPRVIRVLRDGSYYSCIRDCEMNLILSLTNEDYLVDYSKLFIGNSKIIITDGPLKGKEGLVKKIDRRKRRATIEIEFLNQTRLINLGIELIDKIS